MIYVTGDMHGEYAVFGERKLDRLKKGDKLIVTGDFGFVWDNSKEEIKNLARLSKKKYDVLFVEGAHENFERLKGFPEADLYRGKAYKLAHNVYCLKRGEVYYIDGRIVLALGGGRDPYDAAGGEALSMPTDEELQYAVDNIRKLGRRIDLIVTHEAPASVKRLIDRDAAVNDLNLFLDTVMHNTAYRHWYFGSLHRDRQVSERLTCVFEAVHKAE
jgi:hypothetical protein